MDYKDFWETHHKNKDQGWLTGTRLGKLLTDYSLSESDIKDKKVLEIGVGYGHSAEEIRQHASEFYCADISQTALERVSSYAKQTFLSEDLNKCPPVDVAFCHLVLVHCDDDETLRIINDINLTENGKGYLQFSEAVGNIDPYLKENLIDNGTHFFRNFKQIKELISKSNKEMIEHHNYDPGVFSLNGKNLLQNWFCVTIQNKREEQ